MHIFAVLQKELFGNLNRELLRFDPVLCNTVEDLRRYRRILELLGRYVNRDMRQADPASLEFRDLLACGLDHPVADATDQA